MKKILLFCAIIFCNNLFAQQSTFIAGKNILDNSDIRGISYKFFDDVFRFFVDENSFFLTAQLQGTVNNFNGKLYGVITQYDLNNGKVSWSNDENYKNLRLFQTDKQLVLSNSERSRFINSKTKSSFDTKHQVYFVSQKNNIALGYKTDLYKADYYLEGINLTNGNKLWKTKIPRNFGWNDVLYLNDTTLLIASDGLHSVNLMNGESWHYAAITGQKNYNAGKNLRNVGMGLLQVLIGFGSYYVGENLLYNVNSNVLIDNEFIYFASMEQIAKIDKNSGNIIWTNKFPKKEASKSMLFEKDNLIIMINQGVANFDNTTIPYGKPFVAVFDKETGEYKYSYYTKEQISDFDILSNFADNKVFTTNDNNVFFSLENKFYILTDENIFNLDKILNINRTKKYDNLYIFYAEIGENKLIGNATKTFIIDKNGIKLAEISVSYNAVLKGNKLFEKKGNIIEIINLEKYQ